MALEPLSNRIAVVVTISVRLFDATLERDTSHVPTAGPAARTGMKPTLKESGSPSGDDYRRTWTVGPPAVGVAPALASSDASAGAVTLPTVYVPSSDASGAIPTTSVVYVPGPSASGSSAIATIPTVTVSADESAALLGPVLVGARGDEKVIIARQLCRKSRITLRPHRVADEASITLDLRAFPLPPDGSIVRSALVEARIGVVDADDWALAVSTGAVGDDGRPLSVPLFSDDDDPIFTGFADWHRVRFPEDGASVVELPCRSFAGLLADEKSSGRTIDTTVPVDEAIATWMGTIPAMVGIAVVWVGPDTPPTLGAFGPRAKKKRVRAGAAAGSASTSSSPSGGTTKTVGATPRSAPNGDRTTCLDQLAEYCTLAGIVFRFIGYRLEIGPPRTLSQWDFAASPHMLLGRNILELELGHKLTRGNARAVEVRSFDPDTGRMVAARWPIDPKRFGPLPPGQINIAPPSGPLVIPPGAQAIDEQGPEVFDVHGITDPTQLQTIARNAFEEASRQNLEAKLGTRDFATIEGRAGGRADLLTLRTGSSLTIAIAPSIEEDAGSYVQRLASMGPDEAIATLVADGWPRDVAERFYTGIFTVRRPFTYYVRDLEITSELDSGTHFEIGLINYIESLDEAWRDKSASSGASTLADPSASWADKWSAVDADVAAGKLTPAQGAAKQAALADDEAKYLASVYAGRSGP